MIINFSNIGSGSGGGTGATYQAGDYIQISANTISVTGLTSEEHSENVEEVVSRSLNALKEDVNTKQKRTATYYSTALPDASGYDYGVMLAWWDTTGGSPYEYKGLYMKANGGWYRMDYDFTTTLSSASTDTQLISAKAVYDEIGDIETLLASI